MRHGIGERHVDRWAPRTVTADLRLQRKCVEERQEWRVEGEANVDIAVAVGMASRHGRVAPGVSLGILGPLDR